MEFVDTEEVKEVFGDLKKSIDQFYSKYSELDTNGTIDMKDILRNCAKMEHFLNGEFYNLWQMEQDERRKLTQKLESIGTVCCKVNCTANKEDSKETSGSCDSMPPLINTDDVSQPVICEPTQMASPSELPVYERKKYDDISYPLYYTPPTASLWGSWSNPSLITALAFNKSVMNR